MSGSKARLARRKCAREGHKLTKNLNGGVYCVGCQSWVVAATYPTEEQPSD